LSTKKKTADLPGDPGESGEAPEAAGPAEAVSSSEDLAAAIEPAPDATAVEAFHQRARLAEDRLAEVLAAYRALKKETEAHRERIARNLERRYDQRRERLLLKFIDILDNMDRALDAAEKTYAGEPLIEGLILVRTQLLQTVKDEGLERIPVLGMAYDPHVSEAVGTQRVDDPDQHGIVVKEHLRGYRLNGRLARASRVTVGEHAAGSNLPESTAQAEIDAVDADQPVPEAPPDDEFDDISPPPPPPGSAAAPTTGGSEEPSLEDIIARAEAQEALFPDAFDGPSDGEKKVR